MSEGNQENRPVMTFAEIGKAVGVTAMGAHKIYTRAMKKLHEDERLKVLAKESAE